MPFSLRSQPLGWGMSLRVAPLCLQSKPCFLFPSPPFLPLDTFNPKLAVPERVPHLTGGSAHQPAVGTRAYDRACFSLGFPTVLSLLGLVLVSF